jgi:hypothetical protein
VPIVGVSPDDAGHDVGHDAADDGADGGAVGPLQGADPVRVGAWLAEQLDDQAWSSCTMAPVGAGRSNLTFRVQSSAGVAGDISGRAETAGPGPGGLANWGGG